jgi:hypothetical protein
VFSSLGVLLLDQRFSSPLTFVRDTHVCVSVSVYKANGRLLRVCVCVCVPPFMEDWLLQPVSP